MTKIEKVSVPLRGLVVFNAHRKASIPFQLFPSPYGD